MSRTIVLYGLLIQIILGSSGCSTLGLSLWPAEFPLLNRTKEFASRSPISSGLPHELAKLTLPEYYLEPGDRILIEPVAIDSRFRMIGDQKVQVDGSIDLGQYGRLRVSGMTVESIEAAIIDRIEQAGDEAEAINVQLIEANAAAVYVLGEVGSPGRYPIDGRETVLDAIVLAGGLTARASPCDMILVRPTGPSACRFVQRVCYRQITQLGDVTTNHQLQPGDRIVVGTRTLREELAVWKQRTACECCDRSRCVECQPAKVSYRNRFSHMLVQFPLPWRPSETDEVAAGNAHESGALEENGYRPAPVERIRPSNGTTSELDDSDIFLPPALPTQTRNTTIPDGGGIAPANFAPIVRSHGN